MLDGRCGCGAVTYRLKTKPMFVHCCHCSDCQRQTGSAFVLNAIIESDRIEFDGLINEVMLATPSGKGQVITRCAECGAAVFSSYLIRHDKIRAIRVGTLDHADKCPPDVHIFTSSKLPWVSLNSDVPVFEDIYDLQEVWPETALTRWRKVFGD